MIWNSIMGFISTLALLAPVVFIIVLGLWNYRSFPALLVYFVSVFIYNLFTVGYVQADPAFVKKWGLINNLMDAPLLLYFFTYFSTSRAFLKRTWILIISFLVFEAAVIAWKGLNVESITIILGPGLALLIGYSLFFFIRQTKITIMYQKAAGKAIIASALIFSYGCYGILYIIYYIIKTPQVEYSFLIYFFIATVSSGFLAAGIFHEKKRIRKLQELKLARKELAIFYQGANNNAPVRRTVFLDFDKEPY